MAAPTTTPEPDANERALRELELFLLDARAFRLGVATFDFPETRDEMILLLEHRFDARDVYLSRLDLTRQQHERNLLRRLEEHLRAQKAPAERRHAVMIVGLESTLDYPEETSETAGSSVGGLEMLSHLNLQRERFPEVCPYPIVLWLSRLATSALARAAPDFWHWRSATFLFEREEPRWESGDVAMVAAPLSGEQGIPSEARSPLLEALRSLGPYSRQDSPRQRAERVHLATLAGIELFRSGAYDLAGALFDQALDVARTLDDHRAEPQVLALLGENCRARRDLDRALGFFEQALAAARETRQQDVELRALEGLGAVSAELGKTERFLAVSDEALRLAREVRDPRAESRILSELGAHEARRGAYDRAIERFQEALHLSRRLRDRRVESQCLSNLGTLHRISGDLRQAVGIDRRALALARETGDRKAESHVLGNLGASYARLGEPQRAREHLEASLALARELGHRELEAKSSWNLGLLHAQVGELARAAELMQRLVDEERAQGHPDAAKHAEIVEALHRERLANENP